MVCGGRSHICRPFHLFAVHRDADYIHTASPAQIDGPGEDRRIFRSGSSRAVHIRHRSQLRLRQIVLQQPESIKTVRRAPCTLPFSLLSVSQIKRAQLGPFVDSSHQCVREGDVDMSPSEMFEHHFLAPLKAYLNATPGSIALIVPNVRDIISNVASFPQAGFEPNLVSNDDVRAAFVSTRITMIWLSSQRP